MVKLKRQRRQRKADIKKKSQNRDVDFDWWQLEEGVKLSKWHSVIEDRGSSDRGVWEMWKMIGFYFTHAQTKSQLLLTALENAIKHVYCANTRRVRTYMHKQTPLSFAAWGRRGRRWRRQELCALYLQVWLICSSFHHAVSALWLSALVDQPGLLERRRKRISNSIHES